MKLRVFKIEYEDLVERAECYVLASDYNAAVCLSDKEDAIKSVSIIAETEEDSNYPMLILDERIIKRANK